MAEITLEQILEIQRRLIEFDTATPQGDGNFRAVLNDALALADKVAWQAGDIMRLTEEVAALRRELADYSSFYEETRPTIDDVHEYVQKHKLGIGGQDVLKILLADAKHLRAQVEALRNTKDPIFVMGFGTPDAAPVEPEIKKGDKVGVIRAHGHGDKKLIGLEGIVTEVRDGEELTYRYTVKIGERRHLMARDQIIPLSAD